MICKDVLKAKEILDAGDVTCVLCKKDVIYKCAQRGVKPLLDWLESDLDFKDFSAADKVVGNAAAFLYVLMGIKAVYSPVMSEAAICTLEKNGIRAYYDSSVKYVINRMGTGKCPMEEAVSGISSAQEALRAVKIRLNELSSSNL